jgi:hypothetical protein
MNGQKTVVELIGELAQYPGGWLVFDIDGMSVVPPDGYGPEYGDTMS